MTLCQGPASNVFEPLFYGQPISVLFLVENSSEMSHIWPSIFERGLMPIVNSFQRGANALGPLSVIVLESFPTDNGVSGLAPRQYSDFQAAFSNMRFNPHSENQISIGRITQGIELLESVDSGGQPPFLHLVVVAAKPPADDETGVPFPSDYSPWRFVSQRLVASQIRCHLVVTQEVSLTSVAKLYEETLQLTPNLVKEEYCISQSQSSGIVVRLTMRRNDNLKVFNERAATPLQYAQQQVFASQRNLYPMSNGIEQMNTRAPLCSTEPDASPRLLSQLQSVHPLTKKKVYGAQEPFFGREVRQKLATPLLTATMGDISSGGGRVLTHSKIHRIGRRRQASPTSTHARRHKWLLQGSRLSTPEAENLGWGNALERYQQSQGATQQPGGMLGGMDASVDMAGICGPSAMGPALTHTSNIYAAMAQYAGGGMADPQWLTQSQQQPMQPQPHHRPFSHQYTVAYNNQPAYYNQTPVQRSLTGNYLHNNAGVAMSDMHPQRSFSAIHNSFLPFPGSLSAQPALPTPTVPSNAGAIFSAPDVPDLTLEELTSVRPPKRTTVSTPADSETFDFSAPFVAATRLMFEQEIVPFYPNIPNIRSDISMQKLEADLAKLDSPSDAGELFATRMPKAQQQAASPQNAGPNMSLSASGLLRGPKRKVPQMAPPPPPQPQRHQQQQLQAAAPMTYSGGYHNVAWPSNIGHATFPSSYITNYASSSLTGWAG